MFSCKTGKIFKNTDFAGYLQAIPSVYHYCILLACNREPRMKATVVVVRIKLNDLCGICN